MELIINSPKYGKHICYYDDEDHELLSKYRWYVQFNPLCGKFYAQHSWKRAGEEVTLKMHRFILGVSNSKIHVDHRDGNSLNNRKSNLRVASPSQNSMNRGKTIKNKSGYKGVVFESKKALYRVVITFGKKVIRAGRYKDPVEAAKKYNELAIKYHGEFAYINPIPNV